MSFSRRVIVTSSRSMWGTTSSILGIKLLSIDSISPKTFLFSR